MNKYEQINEIVEVFKDAIGNNALIDMSEEECSLDCGGVDNAAEQCAESLYNLGYRKTFTSEFTSEIQKAFKEGYQKGVTDTDEWKHRAEVAEKALFDFYREMLAIPSFMIATQGVEKLLQQAEREIAERSEK